MNLKFSEKPQNVFKKNLPAYNASAQSLFYRFKVFSTSANFRSRGDILPRRQIPETSRIASARVG